MVNELLSNIGIGSFVVDTIIWLLVLLVLFFGGFWFFVNKMWYKYHFIIVDTRGNFKEHKAKIVKNKSGIKKFAIKEYNTADYWLPVKEHNGNFNGKIVRFCSWDGMGNLTYLDGWKLHKDKYMETALLEIERTEAVDGHMEAAEKANMMTQIQKWMLTGMVTLGIFMMITLMMVAKFGFEQVDSVAAAGEYYKTAGEHFVTATDQLRANTIASEALVGALIRNNNLSIEYEFGTE